MTNILLVVFILMLSEFIPFPDYYIVVLISTLITSPKLHTHHRHINKRDKMDVLLEWKIKIQHHYLKFLKLINHKQIVTVVIESFIGELDIRAIKVDAPLVLQGLSFLAEKPTQESCEE